MSANFVPADAAIREDVRTDLDASVCVEAGAGTGKTTVLVNRLVELLRRGPHGVDDVAVMTFTDAAAAELAARAREGLEKALTETQDEAERERLEHALLGLYRARIETIHAFATNLLRERPVEASLDPGFTVLDPLGAEQRFNEAWRTWLDETLASEAPEISTAIARGLDLNELRQLADSVHAHRYLLPLTHEAQAPPDASSFAVMLERLRSDLARLCGSCTDESDGAYRNAQQLTEFAHEYREADGAERERLVLFGAPWPTLNAGSQSRWSPAGDCAHTKNALREYREALGELREALRREALAGVLPAVENFVAEHERQRRADGEADYDDLLIWARDLLRDNLEVREYFQRRFPRVFLDEFQDTDPVQAEIVIYIAAEGASDDWRSLRPGPGRLFIVGDPKQSIYRFRRADIAVYDDVKAGPLDNAVRPIVQNFRSHPEIIGFVNRVFDRVLVEKIGVQPGNVALEPLPSGIDAGRGPVVIAYGSGDDATADEIRTEEAGLLAELISRAVRDERWPVRDRRQDGRERTCQWRDVAILMPARTGVERFTEALADADIPYRLEGSRTFFERQEVRDLISCLRAIDDPLDQISLIGALRSRACGCSDEELFLWHEAGGAFDLRLDQQDREPVAVWEALDMLGGLRRARRSLSLPELVRAVLRETGLIELALAGPRGEQPAANLLKVAEQAHAFAASGGGLRAFAGWLADQRDDEEAEQEAGAVEEIDDVVRLVTIHSSKGLEYPIVALANFNTGVRRNSKRPIPSADTARLHLSIGKRGGDGIRFETQGYAQAEDAENDMIDAEAVRLMYVALTRARDHLIVPVVGPVGKEKGMLSWLLPDLPDREGAEPVVGCHLYDVDDIRTRGAPPEDDHVDRKAVNAALKARIAWQAGRREVMLRSGRERPVTTATSVERLWERPLTVEVSEGDGSIIATGAGAPLPLGDAVHRVMELVDLGGSDDLSTCVEAIARESGLVDRQQELLDLARACLASAAVRRAADSGAWWREVPFGIHESDGPLGFGRMDLIYRDGERLVVVDYKTDSVGVTGIADAVQGHRDQAVAYARAARAATGLEVDRVVFVFARAGGAEGSISAEELAA